MTRDEVKNKFNQLVLGEYDFQAFYDFAKKMMDDGPLPEEIKGFIDSTAERSVKLVPKLPDNAKVIDISSSGGDKINSINVGSIASLVLAAGGLVVGKNAARAISGHSGSSDIFDELGIPVSYTSDSTERVEKSLEDTAFAAYYYPAFDLEKYGANSGKFLRELREKNLSFVTPWNVAAWLYNPLQLDYRIYGMFSDKYFDVAAEVLLDQGIQRGWIVYGVDGLDEISNVGTTEVLEFSKTGQRRFTLQPEDFGIKKSRTSDIAVNSKEESFRIAREVISGERNDAFRDLVVINAASGFYISGISDSLIAAMKFATDLLESGKVQEKLEEIRTLMESA